jgi:CelD/BcsL family acetyltransferase involved in cellulose biosynthesis
MGKRMQISSRPFEEALSDLVPKLGGSSYSVSPFTTPEWLMSWGSLPVVRAKCNVLVGHDAQGLAGYATAGIYPRRDFGIIPFNEASFIESGDLSTDVFAPEYNPFAIRSRDDRLFTQTIMDLLFEKHRVDRVRFAGIEDQLLVQLRDIADAKGLRVMVERSDMHHWFDLDTVRARDGEISSCLGPNTRRHLRRGLRAFGPVQVETAETPGEAHVYLDRLILLHKKRWASRGSLGAFAQPCFEHVLRRLIDTALTKGFAEVARVSSRNYDLAYLFNLHLNGVVYSYVTGIDFREPKLHPGLVADAAFISHLCSSQATRYDLMAGTSPYKQSLCTHSSPLYWVRLEKKNIRTRLSHWTRVGIRALRR